MDALSFFHKKVNESVSGDWMDIKHKRNLAHPQFFIGSWERVYFPNPPDVQLFQFLWSLSRLSRFDISFSRYAFSMDAPTRLAQQTRFQTVFSYFLVKTGGR